MTPVHRDMVLRMFRRGLTIPAIHQAMAGALPLTTIRSLISEKTDADRRAAEVIRRQRLHSTEKAEARAREQIKRERRALIDQLGYRVLTVRKSRVSSKFNTENNHV